MIGIQQRRPVDSTLQYFIAVLLLTARIGMMARMQIWVDMNALPSDIDRFCPVTWQVGLLNCLRKALSFACAERRDCGGV